MDKRECKKLNIGDEYKGNSKIEVELFIDIENSESIMKAITKIGDKKFKRIVYEIFSNRYNDNLYGKENISKNSKNITAMKSKGKPNIRIYCKEFFIGNKKIVMIIDFIKKTQKIDKKLKTLIEKIGRYEYEFNKD